MRNNLKFNNNLKNYQCHQEQVLIYKFMIKNYQLKEDLIDLN